MSDIAKAQLVIGSADPLPVQFNPASLQVEISNSVTPQGGEGNSHQVSTSSSAKLDLTLLFDTSGSGEDVRSKTRPIRACVRAPVTGDIDVVNNHPSDRSQAFVPPTVRFEWGTFLFIGVADNFRETLDFFSADGVPLRAEVVLALKEQAERHTALERTNDGTPAHAGAFDVPAGGPLPPRTAGNNSGSGFGLSVRLGLGGAAGVAQQGGDLRAARAIATANGQDNLRFASGPTLGVAPGPAPRPAPSTAGGSGTAAVNSRPVSPLRFDARQLARSGTPASGARQLATDAGAAFSVDGRALPQTDAGLRSDVGVNRSLAGRLRFEE
jgi:hypothetical protein